MRYGNVNLCILTSGLVLPVMDYLTRNNVNSVKVVFRTKFSKKNPSYSSLFGLYLFSAHWTEKATYVLFWGGASVLSALAIFAYGDDFVDHPRFCPD